MTTHPDDLDDGRLPSVCPDCGAVFTRDDSKAKCTSCQPVRSTTSPQRERRRGSARARGYDAAWDRLSKRARRLSPLCEDCGTHDDLTTDHSPQAWERRAAGLPIRLRDVSVVCRRCNGERGPARGPDAGQHDRWTKHRTDLEALVDRLDDDRDHDLDDLDDDLDP